MPLKSISLLFITGLAIVRMCINTIFIIRVFFFGMCKCEAKPSLPTNFEDTTWENLQSAIRAIFLKQPFPFDLERLYQVNFLPFFVVVIMSLLMKLVCQAVGDLCLHKLEGKLYERIEKECEEHISAALRSLVGQDTDLSVFLSLVEKCWQDFCDQMLMIRSIALSLDRKYVIQHTNVRSLWEMGLQLFRKHLSLSPDVEQRTVTALLRMIERER